MFQIFKYENILGVTEFCVLYKTSSSQISDIFRVLNTIDPDLK
jgi:hypothetical protein